MVNISQKEYKRLAEYIKENYGINLGDKKQTLVAGRLHNVLTQNNFSNFTDYFNFITSDPTGNAIVTLINKITTNYTFFMRENDHFFYFKDTVLPYYSGKIKDRDLRIWSAGCSSGEEPYTLAMLIDEYFGKEKYLWDAKILATDISSNVLETATKGIYKNEQVASLPINWIYNYFKKYDNENMVFIEKIKNEIIYRKLNLMDKNFPFRKKFHVIFCRNVMIYFENSTKDELVEKLYDLLEPGGYLFIGHSETLNREKTFFKYIMPAVYRKE